MEKVRLETDLSHPFQYRSYVLNCNLGKDIVTEYIENQGDDQSSRWQAFEHMLTELPSGSDMAE